LFQANQLRNPQLYARLCKVFGANRVVVRKPGEKGEFVKGEYEHQGYKKFRTEKVGSQAGEEFAVSCPLGCGDTHGRLAINHMWGTMDPYSGKRILWLCHCYNEECQAEYENRKLLAEIVFGDDTSAIEINESVDVKPVKRKVTLPGAMLDLLTLAKSRPDHPAVQFAYGKGYDITELSQRYGVGYCVGSAYAGGIIEGRLVAPWYTRRGGKSRLAGWTARRITTDADTPKWYHSSSATGSVVYGLGEAAAYRTVVVVEGPGDKWSVGPPGGATLGKGIRTEKAKLIANATKSGKNRLVVVLQDPDQDPISAAKGKPHHIEQAVAEITKYASCPVIGVYLPPRTDPGLLDRGYVWDYIYREAKGQGVKASNKRID